MTESRMPTPLTSPVDRREFGFVAVDASGAVWQWVDKDMVWVHEPDGAVPDRWSTRTRR